MVTKNSRCLCSTGIADTLINLRSCFSQSWCRSWILRRIVWTVDYIYIARTGEEAVIDSIPFAEVEKITNSESLDCNNIQAAHRLIFDTDRRNGMASKVHPDSSVDMRAWKIRSSFQKYSQKVFDRTSTGIFGSFTEEKEESKVMLQINTVPDGFNSGCSVRIDPFILINLLSPICAGRTYYCKVPTVEQCRDMVFDFRKRAERARKAAEAKSSFERNQEYARNIFNSSPFQFLIACLIFAVRLPLATQNPY
jgi:hypothetical protein